MNRTQKEIDIWKETEEDINKIIISNTCIST